ncbi:MAG TPA: hypothetical protein DCX83_09180 [Pseudomonas sp.]|nr:hypothetical protein [Pseudomonas sp.]
MPSSTSSTSSGNSKGIGTLQSVARTATRLARIKALRWCSARRRISAQLSWSGMRVVLQPAAQEWSQHRQRLVAIGEQGQLALVLGEQGREPGDTKILDPAEIR